MKAFHLSRSNPRLANNVSQANIRSQNLRWAATVLGAIGSLSLAHSPAIARTTVRVPASSEPYSITLQQIANRQLQNSSSTNRTQRPRYKPKRHSLGDFSNTGAPRSRGAAGSRGNCPEPVESQPPAQALVPLVSATIDGETVAIPFGTTVSTHPTFWFQIPYQSAQLNSLELVLVNEIDQALVEEIQIEPQLAAQPSGLWAISWPQTAVALEPDSTYRWFLIVNCRQDSADLVMSGLIQRELPPPELTQQLAQVDEHEHTYLYAEYGIWHDALAALSKAYEVDSSHVDWKSDLTQLLESAGLSQP